MRSRLAPPYRQIFADDLGVDGPRLQGHSVHLHPQPVRPGAEPGQPDAQGHLHSHSPLPRAADVVGDSQIDPDRAACGFQRHRKRRLPSLVRGAVLHVVGDEVLLVAELDQAAVADLGQRLELRRTEQRHLLEAIKGYYEGLPRGTPIPWEVWVEPMAWWLGLVVAMGFMLICLSGILHRQWSTHERLAYPMMQLPQGMLAGEEGGVSKVAPLFRNPIMWVGFSLPFLYLSMKGLNFYFPFLPDPNLSTGFPMFRGTVHLPMRVVFAYVGFFYLASLDLTFSVWFFFVFYKIQEGIFNVLGIASTERLSAYESYPPAADLVHQQTGAVIVFILFGLWSARVHLRDVMRSAWSPRKGIDDSEELLRYRTAVIGFLVSFTAVGIWLWRSGVPAVYVPVLLIVSVIFFALVARVVATAGVPTARSPIVPAYFIISGFGTSMLGTKGLVALTYTFIWQGESRTSPMVAASNGLKLAESVKGSKTRLFWGLIIALVASLLASLYTTLELSYSYGAINLNPLKWAGGHGWPYIGPTSTAMPEANMRGWLFRGIGGAFEFLLMWGQHRWHWWPLHPIGFTIAFGWLTSSIWFSALIAWILKAIILHVGGGKLFRTLKPFFLGLILGEVLTGGGWGVIYALTVENGRVLSHM